MKKRIKTVGDLPAWFDRSKYLAAKKLDATGWYEQLSFRKDLQQMLRDNHSVAPFKSTLEKVTPIFFDNPIVDLESNETLKILFLGGRLSALKKRDLTYTGGVGFTTCRQLFLGESSIPSAQQKAGRDWIAFLKGDFDHPSDRNVDFHALSKWLDDPVHLVARMRPTITIDPDLPDEMLIKDFKNVLAFMRDPDGRCHHPAKVFRRPDFAGWVGFGVLPYIDLCTWAETANVQIPNRVMADAIFEPGEGGEEVVRKTSEKLARDLMSDGHLNQLASFAAYEIAEDKGP